MRSKKLLVVSFALFILCVIMIFYFSSQTPSTSLSQSGFILKVIREINEIFDITDTKYYEKAEYLLKNIILKGKYETSHALVRKSAHIGIYLLLGIVSTMFMYLYSKKTLVGFLLGVTFPVTIAVLDEYNQSFIGRTSSLNDVIIDGLGAATGALIMVAILIVYKMIFAIIDFLRDSKSA